MKNGRPYARIKGKGVNVRRNVYKEYHRVLPDIMNVTLTCTSSKCINVNHMVLVSKSTFMRSLRHKRKLTEEQIIDIFRSEDPQDVLAERYNVSQSTISRYRNYRTSPVTS